MLDRFVLTDPASGAVITSATPVGNVPTPIKYAEYELALGLLSDSANAIQSTPGAGSNVRSTSQSDKVGDLSTSSSIEYFNRTLGVLGRFPQIVQELLRPYLGAGSAALLAPFAAGLDTERIFDRDRDFGFSGDGLP
jgi:hypothetical protein